MKQKKEYIKPESLIQKIYDEEDLLEVINVSPGEHDGDFGAKKQDLVIEDDYDDDEVQQTLTLKSFKPWDDGEAKDDKTLTW